MLCLFNERGYRMKVIKMAYFVIFMPVILLGITWMTIKLAFSIGEDASLDFWGEYV